MKRQEVLAAFVRASPPLLERFLAGFDDSTRTRQAPGLPNHVAWTLGHLALTLHRAAERFDSGLLPEADFRDTRTQPPLTTAQAGVTFDTESVSFASTPAPDPSRYPTLARAREILQAATERFAGALESASDQALAGPHPWGATQLTAEELICRLIAHQGTHTGQIIDLRRSLGMPRVIG
ncbi:MAG: DinB family protein [Phycisphaeraceae bacterium]|nr:DinB family protein [Phycisphaeraceae bacterium]